MFSRSDIMEIRQEGNEAVVRFHSLKFPNELALEECRRALDDCLKSNPCDVLTFDLDGVVIIPSTMLGLLLAYRQRGLRVRILNPSEHVLAVLQVTKLTSRIEVEPTATRRE
jgi:anti-anti-sigma factor